MIPGGLALALELADIGGQLVEVDPRRPGHGPDLHREKKRCQEIFYFERIAAFIGSLSRSFRKVQLILCVCEREKEGVQFQSGVSTFYTVEKNFFYSLMEKF